MADPVVATVIRQAVDIGEKRERDRVTTHLDAGRKVGDLKMAIHAILNGDDMTPEIMRHYLAAGRNRADIAARLEDDEAVEAALLNAKRPPSRFTDPEAAAVFDQLSALVNAGDGDVAIEDLDEDA